MSAATVFKRLTGTKYDWLRNPASMDAEQRREFASLRQSELKTARAWALIRQWTGFDAAVAQREAEIQKLERLVWDAVYALQKAGLDNEAARLRRALDRR